jgi:hypothetical protein
MRDLTLDPRILVSAREPKLEKFALKPISNNVGPAKSFLRTLLRSLLRVVFLAFLGPLLRRPRLARNLSVGFSPKARLKGNG